MNGTTGDDKHCGKMNKTGMTPKGNDMTVETREEKKTYSETKKDNWNKTQKALW